MILKLRSNDKFVQPGKLILINIEGERKNIQADFLNQTMIHAKKIRIILVFDQVTKKHYFTIYNGGNGNENPPFSPVIEGFRRKWAESYRKLTEIDGKKLLKTPTEFYRNGQNKTEMEGYVN